MIYFSAPIPFNEVVRLKVYLPEDSFCLINRNMSHSSFFGALKDEAYSSLIENLSGETLLHLEYLDTREFHVAIASHNLMEITGNPQLILA